MKKILFSSLLLLSATMLRADDRSQEILEKMAATFHRYTSYRIDFTASMAGEFTDLPGTLIVSGDKYYLDVYDSEIFFDGKTGYTYTEANNEVILEIPDPADYRLFANPARIFQVYEEDFNAIFKSNEVINGKNTSLIELKPKSDGTGYNTLSIYADPESGIPLKMVYRLDDYGKDLVLNVMNVSPNVPVSTETFIFSPANYPEVEIIDFR